MLLTRLPLLYTRRHTTARLACLSHAASVHSEPGSNSPYEIASQQPQPGVILTLYLSFAFSTRSLNQAGITTLKFIYYSVPRTFAQSISQRTVSYTIFFLPLCQVSFLKKFKNVKKPVKQINTNGIHPQIFIRRCLSMNIYSRFDNTACQ